MEATLGRKVRFEKVHFTLFSGPGFSLENVTILEDPQFGLEPFAFVPEMQARLKLDKLLFGQIRFASLRLIDPSLNMVRRDDGTWNIVKLVRRLGAPSRVPFAIFPTLEVKDGRVDFKLGTRKTMLYLSEAELSVYPQRSGKLRVQFAGSPSRTDRAGVGFGRFRGSLQWTLTPGSPVDALAASVRLEPSNLSELTTLIQGHDLGIHGNVSSELHAQGPISALHIRGSLHLDDVHRWDLLPSSGDNWNIYYLGDLDIPGSKLYLRNIPPPGTTISPVTLQLRLSDFLSRPHCALITDLKDAPLGELQPLAERLGVPLPNGAKVTGSLDGAVSYSNTQGWDGAVYIRNASAVLPNAPALHTPGAMVQLGDNRVHVDPAPIDTSADSTVSMGGTYWLDSGKADASVTVTHSSISNLKPVMSAWFAEPEALSAFSNGMVDGQFAYAQSGDDNTASGWSGLFNFDSATLSLPGLAAPIQQAKGRISFDGNSLELDRLSAAIDGRVLHASYRYNAGSHVHEHVRAEIASASWTDLERWTKPPVSGSLWSRLRFLHAPLPAWLKERSLEANFSLNHVLASDGTALGQLTTRFIWQGTQVDLQDLNFRTATGNVEAHGTVSLTTAAPRWQLAAKASGLRWKEGELRADGEFSGTGWRLGDWIHTTGAGRFSARNVRPEETHLLTELAGRFSLSLADGWPNLQLSDVSAASDGGIWTGEGRSDPDGSLLIHLQPENSPSDDETASKPIEIVSSLKNLPAAADAAEPPDSHLPQ